MILLIAFIICFIIRKRYGAQSYLNSLSAKKPSLFKSKSKSYHGNSANCGSNSNNNNNNNNQVIARHYCKTNSKEYLTNQANKSSTFTTNYGL